MTFGLFQVLHNSSQLPKHLDVSYSSLQLLLNKYCALFSEKSPKGFGKFFGERGGAKQQKSDDKEKSSSSSSSKDEPPPSSSDKKQDDDVDILKKLRAEYKSFGGGPNPGGLRAEKPGNDREKWFTFGMIGSALVIAALSYYGYSYQEITWKDLTK